MTYDWAIGWVALLPFIRFAGSYEGPKVFWLWIGGFVLAVQWFFRVRSRVPSFTAEGRWFMAWVGVLLVSSIAGIHPVDSVIGGGYRHQGVLFFLTLWLLGETLGQISQRSRNVLAIILGIAPVLQSVLLVVQRFGQMSLRPAGTFGEPNSAAGFLSLGLFWIYRLPVSGVLRTVFLIMTVCGILATGSRTGLAAAFVVISGIGSAELRKSSQVNVGRHRTVLLAGTIVFGAILGAILGYSFAVRPQSLYENRPLFWRMGLDAVMRQPLGYGAESGETVFRETFARHDIDLWDFVIDRAHNIFLDIAMWSGLPGLAVFGIWLSRIATNRRNTHEPDRIWPILGWLTFALFQPVGVVQWVHLILLAYFLR